MTCDVAIKLSAFLEYTEYSVCLISSEGCVISTPLCARLTANSNPSSGVSSSPLSLYLLYCYSHAQVNR